MKRRLMIGLLAGGLMAAMMPGVTSAAAGGNSVSAMDCRENHAAYGFSNQGACTSYFARGGDPTFQIGCVRLDGTYLASDDSSGLAPYCEWYGQEIADRLVAIDLLSPLCPAGTILWGLISDSIDPDYVGCKAAP